MPILPNLPNVKVFWYAPAPIFVARVNLASPVYPIADIPYDGVTAGAYTDVHADMLVTFGSAEGLDDLGRARTRAIPTSSILKIGRSSQGVEDGQVDIVDNAWIHIYRDWRVWSKIPVIGGDYNEYKDTDIAVGSLTEEPPPIVNMGGDCARSIDADTGTITVFFPGSTSIPVADGATITTYSWEVIGNGTFVNSTTASDADVYIEFEAGVHWVRLTVTDSNGKQNTGHRLVLADDPANTLCIPALEPSITRDRQGATAQFRPLPGLTRAAYPDGAKVMFWEDRDPAIYGEPDPASRDHMLFTGWHQTDQANVRAEERYLHRATTLTCVDVLGRLDSLPGFPQRVEVPTADDLAETGMNWGYMPAANMDKFLAYLLHWHSTAGGVADFFPSGTWDEYPFVLFDAGGDTLYSQLQRQANRIVPDYNFTSDRFGAMRVVPNPNLQNVADRTDDVVGLTYQSISSIDFSYQRPPRVHTTRGSALLTQTEWEIDDDDKKQLLTPVFAIAPGTSPGQGAREVTLGERLAKSQQDLNDCIGHHHARSNARYGDITVTLNSNSDPFDFDPAAHTWVQLLVPNDYAPQRGLDFESIRCLPKEVRVDYTITEEAITRRATVVLERETVGLPALTEVTEEALPVGEQPVPPPVTVPPDSGLRAGQENVVGVSQYHFYRTNDFQTPSLSGGPTWARHDFAIDDSEEILSWVVDPFSPGYLYDAGTIDGWVVTPAAIVRVSDLFGTVGRATAYTFATAIPGDVGWRSIQASFGAYFGLGLNPWLVCVSYYGDTVGHTGTWATYSVDGGATWAAEVQVSEHYDTDSVEAMPIGLYLSPKTPGLAYTAAHYQTDMLSPTAFYKSLDWGETWTKVAVEEDAAHPLPHWGVNGFGSAVLLGIVEGSLFVGGMQARATDATVNPAGYHILFAPPDNAKRVIIDVDWAAEKQHTPEGSPYMATDVDHSFEPGSTQHTTLDDDFNFAAPTLGAFSGGYFVEWQTNGTGDWNYSRDDLATFAGASQYANYTHFNLDVYADALFPTTTALARFEMAARVREIELWDGTIYTPNTLFEPINSHCGAIHLPWPDNDDESIIYYGILRRAVMRQFELGRVSGGVKEDIGPTASGITYGVNHGHFSVRTHDNNRNHVLLGGRGNSTSLDPADDMVGVWKSADAGDSWTQLVAPVAASNALYGLSAAFGGDSEDVIYVWGGYTGAGNVILYADDGVTLDDRAGNLASLEDVAFGGAIAFVGIAGGIE